MYRGLFIADLHIGAMDYETTYDGLMYLRDVLAEYTKDELLDFIIIGGDYFDKQLYSGDPFVALASKFMVYVLSSAKAVRFVNGTSSHDCNQYTLFEPLVEDCPFVLEGFYYNFKVITTVSEEELLPGLNVLYIPEEYIFDQDEYYKEFLSKEKHYDYIFGHGAIREAMTYRKDRATASSNVRKSPVFSSAELSHACKGKTYFGHYHVHTEMEGNVAYVGSTFRWIFGEEEEKGFYFLECDPEVEIYHDQFVINEKAKKYVTVSYGYKDPLFESLDNAEEIVKKLLKRRIQMGIDYLRVIVNIPIDYENPEALILFMKERFSGIAGVKLEFNHGYTEKKKELEAEEISKLDEDGKVLLDENIPEENKVSFFLKSRLDVDMDSEKIKKYLDREDN